MNKDWNYAHMWDAMRRALEESAIQGLEIGPLDVLSGMNTLEALEELHRQEREERERRATREMQTMWDGKLEENANLKLDDIAEWLATFSAIPAQTTVTVPGDMRMDLILAMNAIANSTKAEEAEECE